MRPQRQHHVAELHDDVSSGRRVVDPGRHRPHGDVCELHHTERDVLLEGSRIAEREGAEQRETARFDVVRGWRDPHHWRVGRDETSERHHHVAGRVGRKLFEQRGHLDLLHPSRRLDFDRNRAVGNLWCAAVAHADLFQ
jgi:hypothetical protein